MLYLWFISLILPSFLSFLKHELNTFITTYGTEWLILCWGPVRKLLTRLFAVMQVAGKRDSAAEERYGCEGERTVSADWTVEEGKPSTAETNCAGASLFTLTLYLMFLQTTYISLVTWHVGWRQGSKCLQMLSYSGSCMSSIWRRSERKGRSLFLKFLDCFPAKCTW